ncbi:hypothetical protein [Alkalicoccus luteus]|uniref:hypothetical protein n=1 Tax=Alkalicoccus luteus TaxID=1237094 RepID=UPI001FE43DBC|nr:hypothetical protein [Alkalicoccus luteus]
MAENRQAMEKLARRVTDGYEAVHEKKYSRARQLLEPLVPMLHSESKPNVKLLAYTAIAQIGDRQVEPFLETYEELKAQTPEDEREQALVTRVDEMFTVLMESVAEEQDND